MWAQSSKSFSRRRGTPCRGAAARSGVTIINPPHVEVDAEVETPTPSPAADPGSAREFDLSQKKHPNYFSPSLSRGTCARTVRVASMTFSQLEVSQSARFDP